MKTFDVRDMQGRLLAFEVSNTWLSRRKCCIIISRIPGVEIVRKPKLLSFFSGEEEFCEFKIGTHNFIVWEPFGDSNRYYIGEANQASVDEIKILKEYFEQLSFLNAVV